MTIAPNIEIEPAAETEDASGDIERQIGNTPAAQLPPRDQASAV